VTAPIRWESAHRIIRTIYPPVALFEDIAPDDWSPAQTFGATARADGADGIIYPSVRHPAGLRQTARDSGPSVPLSLGRRADVTISGAWNSGMDCHGMNQIVTLHPVRAQDAAELNRPGIFGGSNSEVNWSHDEQDNEQIQP